MPGDMQVCKHLALKYMQVLAWACSLSLLMSRPQPRGQLTFSAGHTSDKGDGLQLGLGFAEPHLGSYL